VKITNKKLIYIAILSALGLSACGGGGSSTTTAQDSTVTGVITGFGSIFVDGVEYETDDSLFNVDGSSASENELAIGMVVTLTGSVNADGKTGLASNVVFSNEIEGVVLANNYLTDGTLDIMGQTVKVDAETIFDSSIPSITLLDDVVVGNIIEVSGYPTGTGIVHATRLEVKKISKEVSDTLEVKGVVSNLNETAQTFSLANLSVDYSSATFEGLSALANDLYVEVKSTQALSGTTVFASKVELENEGSLDYSGNDGDELEFEGVIVSLGDDMSFVANGQTVFYNTATEFEYGNQSNLLLDARVKVECFFDENGSLIAEEVKFRVKSETEVTGIIESIDLDEKTVTVMGNTYHVGNNTIMRDDKDEGVEPVRYFDLSDVATNDLVEVKYYKDSETNKLMVTKFERDDDDDSSNDDWSVEGVVESVDLATHTMIISGVTVDFGAFPDFSARAGTKVEAEGVYNNSTLIASAVEFDD